MKDGIEMYSLCEELFPINRSLTGKGVRETLNIIKRELSELKIFEVPSGTKCFDWKIPKEWNCNDAYLVDPNGKKICDFRENNLHLVGYSLPINRNMHLEDLQNHLYSLPNNPSAIPYITSYYKERWGFCLKDEIRQNLIDGEYKVFIDSKLEDGYMTYGELIVPGETNQEIFLSTYICHPSMANNELSGPVLTQALAKYIQLIKSRRFTYRIIFIPETIGSIYYLSKHLENMKSNIIAGYNISCVGDDLVYSFLPSRTGDTLSDRIAMHVLDNCVDKYIKYSFLDRGSDERQYCSPNVDLPIACISRSKYGEYEEYHTSKDDLNFISAKGLQNSYEVYKKCIDSLENNKIYKVTNYCEPQLGKRGLYPTLGTKKERTKVLKNLMNFLAYADGKNDLLNISSTIGTSMWELGEIINLLLKEKLIKAVKN